MRVIFLTGANGQLGKEMSKYYKSKEGIKVIETDVDNLDITKIDDVLKMVREEEPYAIINCAAYTAVDNCEDNKKLAFDINVTGAKNLAIAAKEVGAKLVHVSTDYVFEGNTNKPYREMDKPNPISVYGKTKYQSEEAVMQYCDKYFIIRTAWLYGEGKNFVKTMLKLAETMDEVNVVADQYGTPTSVKVVREIIDTLIWTENYGIFHGTCEGECSWADFSEEIFKIAGMRTKVNRIRTGEYPVKADRPKYAVLDNYMLKRTTNYMAPDWKDALKEYMHKYI